MPGLCTKLSLAPKLHEETSFNALRCSSLMRRLMGQKVEKMLILMSMSLQKKDVHAHLANAIATALWMCATSVANRCVRVALCFCVLNANKLFCSSISDLWSNYWIKVIFCKTNT